MPKIRVTIKETHTFNFDSGVLPSALVRELLDREGDGTFGKDSSWSLFDLDRDADTDYDSIVVEEVK